MDRTGFCRRYAQSSYPLFRENSKQVKIQSATAPSLRWDVRRLYKRKTHRFYLPRLTSYNKRLQYQTYDVTGLLSQGSNVIAMALAVDGKKSFGMEDNKNVYGKNAAYYFNLILDIPMEVRSQLLRRSGKSTTGSIIYAEIYNGEIIDARKQRTGWRQSGYDAWLSDVSTKITISRCCCYTK
jgi:alpha-L-rhamnosidase